MDAVAFVGLAAVAGLTAWRRSLAPPPLAPARGFPLLAADAEAALELAVGAGPTAATAATVRTLLAGLPRAASLDTIECVLVSTPEGLEELARELAAAPVFSVDVEHSPRSFHGFVCTLQLSTPWRDWVVDTLVPEVRRRVGPLLGPLTRSRHRLKVVHGAVNDAKWLASNFGLALAAPVVDTEVLARALSEPALSLAALARTHLGVALDKRLQTADWRRRPLPPHWLEYARADSHCLLPLAALLAARLPSSPPATSASPSPLLEVLLRSHVVAQARYDASAAERFRPAPHAAAALRRRRHAPADAADVALVSSAEHAWLLPYVTVALARWRHDTALAADACPNDVLDAEALTDAAGRLAAVVATASAAAAAGGRAAAVAAGGVLDHYMPADHAATATAAVATALAAPDGEMQAAVERWLSGASGDGSDEPDSTVDVTASGVAPRAAGGGISGRSQAGREAVKGARAARVFVARATPLYANISLVAPDGLLLACIDKRKAEWYLEAGAADAVDEHGNVLPLPQVEGAPIPAAGGSAENGDDGDDGGSDTDEGDDEDDVTAAIVAAADDATPGARRKFNHPLRQTPLVDAALALLAAAADPAAPTGGEPKLTLRMRQAPKGLGHAGDAFHLTTKVNACVVCGVGWDAAQASGGLNRLYVVPHAYRQHFPLAAKSYQSHDVVLTCCACHVAADQATAYLARAVARELGVPSTAKEAEERGLLDAGGSDDGNAAAVAAARAARQRAEADTTAAASVLKRAANALLFQRVGMPPERVRELYGDIRASAWLLPHVLEEARAHAAATATLSGSRPKRKQVAGAAAAQRAYEAAEAALAPLLAAGGGTIPDELDDAALRALGLLKVVPVATRAADALLLAAAEGGQGGNDKPLSPSAGSWDVVGDDGAEPDDVSSRRQQPPPPPPPAAAWDPSRRVVRAVLLGDRDPLWARAAHHYPPALPPPCGGCGWEARGVATTMTVADADGTLLQTGRPPHTCERAASDAAGAADAAVAGAERVGSSGLPLDAEERVTRFVQRWRANFLARLRPKAMPQGWSVAYRVFTGGMRKRGKDEPALVREVLQLFAAEQDSASREAAVPAPWAGAESDAESLASL